MTVDYDNIKKLIEDMGSSKLSSLEIDFPDGTKISMKRGNNESQVSKAIYENNEISEIKQNNSIHQESCKKNEDDSQYKYIKSPMVGTFYSKPSPEEKSYIEVGEKIKKGDTTCIIEAMKLMNEIETEFEGEVVEILKKDGDPVEYGENLIKLR